MTKKLKKRHTVLKKCLITLTVLVVLGIFSVWGGFLFITRNANLDSSKLYNKPSNNVVILSSSSAPLRESSSVKDCAISTITKNAFIAKEDKRFYSHKGIDYIRILGALKANIKAKEYAQGGSTITQQLIKNTHLTNDKTIKRKLEEIKLATKLEKELSKDEILNLYLDTIYFGNGQTGLFEASKFYFNKSPDKLSLGESALLSGIISAPSVFNPIANEKLSKEKAHIVLSSMEKEGYISASEKAKAMVEINNFTFENKQTSASVYSSLAEQEALEILNLDKFPTGSKIVIKTYLNSALQDEVSDLTESEYTKALNAGGTTPGIASMVVENSTGGIIAFSGISRHNLYTLKRQPASTIKPILVYAPAFELNAMSPASFVLDEPISINGYTPQNATKKFYGNTTIRDNIVRSTNVPAVKILNEVGIENAKNIASKLGVTFDKNDNSLALALGGLNKGITLTELAGAYTTFANGGEYAPITFIKEIYVNDICVYSHKPQFERVLSKETSYLITDTLKSTAEYGTARKLNALNLPIASKTGTNYVNGKNIDGFNVSYTTKHTILSWIGELEGENTNSDSIYNGSTYPTLLVKNIVAFLYKNTKPADFTMPISVKEVNLDLDEYKKGNLFLADEYSNGTIKEVFNADNLPSKRKQEFSPWDLSFLYTPSQETPNLTPKYTDLIKKYGLW